MQYQTAIPAAPHHPSISVHPSRPRASRSRLSISQSSLPQPPRRLQHTRHIVLRKHLIRRQPAHSVRTAPDRLQLHRRDAAAVTPDAARVAHRIVVPEDLARRREVQRRERA